MRCLPRKDYVIGGTLPDFSDELCFLDAVYEQFFRNYSTRLARAEKT
jgi:hypothetical protein